MTIGERIKNRRTELGLTAEEVAEQLGKSRATVYRYESGEIEKMPTTVLEPLANVLKTTPAYLMGWDDNPMRYEETEENLNAPLDVIEHFNGDAKKIYKFQKSVAFDAEREASLGNLQVLPNDIVYMIPVFESVSAGFGAYACSDVTEYFPMYIENPADAADMLCIKVKGDSMYPKIEEGDIVAVRKQSSVDSGSLAVMLIDGEEGVVKKVNYGPDWIELISINPMYPPRRFEGAEVQRLQVVGLVKKVIKNV